MYLREIKTYVLPKTRTDVHSSTTHNSQKGETTRIPINSEWMNKMWYAQHYRTLLTKRKEILTPATTWMDLEDIPLSETGQSQRTNTVWCPSHGGPREPGSETQRTGRRGPGAGGGEWECVFHGGRVPVWEHGRVLEMMAQMVAQQQKCT